VYRNQAVAVAALGCGELAARRAGTWHQQAQAKADLAAVAGDRRAEGGGLTALLTRLVQPR
jgi:hypothetical protein